MGEACEGGWVEMQDSCQYLVIAQLEYAHILIVRVHSIKVVDVT